MWVKRRIRQSVLEFKPKMRSDIDILVIARPSAHDQDMAIIKKNLEHVFKLANVFVDEETK